MKKILVIGSLNMDLVTMSERHPKLGETIIGKSFFQIPGGKGGNQAAAIGKLGGEVTMFGCVGKDSYGDILIKELKKNDVNIEYIKKSEKNTGIATIVVDENADNTIIVIPGANFEITIEDIDKNIDLIKNADIVLLQLEIPIDIVEYILRKSKEYNKITILNPAPAKKLSVEIIKNVDYLIPNETELELLSEMSTNSEKEVLAASKKLMEMGVKNLIVTMGKNGVIRMMAEKKNIEEAMEFGACVGAITVTKKGAQSSLPTWDEVVNYKF